MLTYSKDEIASQLAWELIPQGTRGLTSVAVCLPELTIAGGFYHLWDNPLLVIPHLFLLNEETKQVADPLRADSEEVTTYYVAGTLGNGKRPGCEDKSDLQRLLWDISDMEKELKSQGFTVKPFCWTLHAIV